MESVLEIKEVSLEEEIEPGPEKISTGRETREDVSGGRDQVGGHTKLESTCENGHYWAFVCPPSTSLL